MWNLAIFASGNGTNCENLIRHFHQSPSAAVKLVVCNHADAPVVARARRWQVPVLVIGRADLEGDKLLTQLRNAHIDFIILAGFLLKIPSALVSAYAHRMVNLHPALLPKHGGKGMYGRHVHEDVKRSGDAETGMTVHWVSNEMDGGDIIAQYRTPLEPTDTVEDIAEKEHQLEMEYFPQVIDEVLKTL